MGDLMNLADKHGLPRWLTISTAVLMVVVVVAGGGLFAYNQFNIARMPVEPTVDSAAVTVPSEPTVDDSGATNALGGAVGALFGYVETYSLEDCDYVAFTAGELRLATPLDSYRGTYESIASGMEIVAELCASDPSDKGAIGLAISTREKVAKILNDREWLGMSNWGTPRPVSGKQTT